MNFRSIVIALAICFNVAIAQSVEKITEVASQKENSQKAWQDLYEASKDAVVKVLADISQVDLLRPYKKKGFKKVSSGFFINSEGEIVTCAHCVDQAKEIKITLSFMKDRQFKARLVGISPDYNIALLRLDEKDLEIIRQERGSIPYLMIGNSNNVRRENEIYILGYPGTEQTVNSAKAVVNGRERMHIQVTATINPGYGGGPVLNNAGRVIGMTASHILTRDICYLIPSNQLKAILDALH